MKNKISITKLYFITLVLLSFQFFAFSKEVIKVGVRANIGMDESIKKWNATTDYLTNTIEGYSFELVPIIKIDDIDTAIKNNEIDFIILNPSFYINFNFKYTLDRVATLINKRTHEGYSEYGEVAFTLTERDDINNLRDIKDKSIMGVDQKSFAGWQMIYRELLEIGIDPYKECSEVIFSNTHLPKDVVLAVLDGKVDVGTVRTGILENLSSKGTINLKNLKIIDPIEDDFPLMRSTRLYPEWAFASLKNINKTLSKKVSIALFQIEKDNIAAVNGKYTGWSIPLNYHSVIELLIKIKAPPFENYGEFCFKTFIKQHIKWLISLLITLISITLLSIMISARNKHLNKSKELEKELEKQKIIELNENKYRALFEDAGDCIIILDLDGNMIDFNKHAYEDYGYTKDEFSKLNVSDLDITESKDKIKFHLRKIEAVGYDRFESQHKKKNGTIIDVAISAKKIVINDKVLIQSIFKNIDDYEKLQQKFKKEENFSTNLTETAGAIILSLGTDEDILSFNKFAEILTGYSKNEVIGGNWFEIFIPEKDQNKIPGVFLDVLKGMGEYSSYENPIICKDGSEKMISWKNSLMYDQDNHISGMLCIGIDITEQMKNEEELNKNEMKLKEAQRLSNVGSWELDLITNKLTWSDEIFKIFDVNPLEFDATYEAFIDIIHPDDRESVNDVYNLSLENKTPYEIEHRLLLKDGTIKFVKEFCETFYNEKGKPTRSFGIVQDISKQKKNAEQIIILKNKYQNLYDNSPDMYASVSAKTGKIIECNNTLLVKTGYEREEIIGKMILEMYHEDSLEKAKGVFEEFKAGNKTTNKNLAIKKKDGEKIHVNLNMEPVKDETGKVTHSISSWRDIGELVAYDNALMASKDLLNSTQELTKMGGWKWNVEDQTMFWTDETYRIHEIDPIEIKAGTKEHIERGVKCYDEDDQKIILEAFNKCVNEGISYDMEFPFTTCKNNRI